MATASKAIPITAGKVVGSTAAHPEIRRLLEKLGLTIKTGTPVAISAGYIIERTAIDGVTKVIAGFTMEPGANLTADGTPKTLTYGSVQNQSAAVLIPVGAPPNDGMIGVLVARSDTLFLGVLGNSGAGSETSAVTDVGTIYGLTKDANGFWYVDKNITVAANGACVEVVELVDPAGTLNGKVHFRVSPAYQQLVA